MIVVELLGCWVVGERGESGELGGPSAEGDLAGSWRAERRERLKTADCRLQTWKRGEDRRWDSASYIEEVERERGAGRDTGAHLGRRGR